VAGKPVAANLAITSDLLPKALVAPRRVAPLKKGLQARLETPNEASVRTKAFVQTLAKANVLQKFIINKQIIFVNFRTGAVVPVEQGQADGSVLLTHNGSLVYFATIVNDVYAYYLTGRKDGAIPPAYPSSGPDTGLFPTTQAGLNQITGFAGKQFVDNV